MTSSLRRSLPWVMVLTLCLLPAAAQQAPYQNPNLPVEQRVEDLLSRMTLEEKIGQMTQINYQLFNPAGDSSSIDVVMDEARLRAILRQVPVGSILNGVAIPGADWVAYIRRIHEINAEESRLNIPILYGIDHVHGANYLADATVFPQQLNIAATFDTTFAHAMGRITALEAAPLGHVWNFAPILDVGRDVRWPRLYETFGESFEVSARLGASYIRGLQNTHVGPYRIAATMKHYLGYSHPRSGWDRTPAVIPMQELYEFHVPSFRAAVQAGAMTVMFNSGEINGIATHANPRLLRTLLRDELGFRGLGVTDWEDIEKLVEMHRVAENEREATRMALDAGIDMSMVPMSLSFARYVLDLVRSGEVSEERIDQSVRRILRTKFELGLFEHVMPTDAYLNQIGSAEHRAEALAAAEASLVLLRNRDNVLPLAAGTRILLMGPMANSKRDLSGGWTINWQGAPTDAQYPAFVETVHQALQRIHQGPVTLFNEASGLRLSNAGAWHDAIVIVFGETPYTEMDGNAYDLTLSEEQRALIRNAASMGLPVVGVYVGGRPRTFPQELPLLDAFIFAGLPGFEGGPAIANVLTGRVAPRGRLPFTWPFGPSHVVPYNHKASEHAFTPKRVSFDFGDGLTYGTLAYENLTVNSPTVTASANVTASVTVRNTGTTAVTWPVLWFLTDEVGRITRPVRELRNFEVVTLAPGASRTLTWTIPPAVRSYPDENGTYIQEPGAFTVQVGDQRATFRVTP